MILLYSSFHLHIFHINKLLYLVKGVQMADKGRKGHSMFSKKKKGNGCGNSGSLKKELTPEMAKYLHINKVTKAQLVARLLGKIRAHKLVVSAIFFLHYYSSHFYYNCKKICFIQRMPKTLNRSIVISNWRIYWVSTIFIFKIWGWWRTSTSKIDRKMTLYSWNKLLFFMIKFSFV